MDTADGSRLVPVRHARTVMIASASAEMRAQMQAVLTADGRMVVETAYAAEVLPLMQAHAPNLLLLGETLLDDSGAVLSGSGYDVCARLKAQLPQKHRLPVIMLLDVDTDEAVDRAFACGAMDFVCGPLRPVVLSRRVDVLLNMEAMRGDLSEKEERYRVISTSISDYAYAYRVVDGSRLVKEWSTHAFETITGYSPSELDGDGWSQLIHPDDLGKALERQKHLFRGHKDVTEFRIITKGGGVRWLMDHAQPVVDETGQVVRIYGAAQDITTRKLTEEMLRQHAAELQERNEELDAFAYTVAHDLKNPIASMMGFTSLVLNYYDRMTPDKVQEYLQLIMDSGYKLKAIINSLLLLAGVTRMEHVQMSPLDMAEVVHEARTRLVGMIEESAAQITVQERFPLVIGYGPWVEEVWANYLSNALKYGGTPPMIEIGADEPEDGQVRFWIKDNGQGLNEAEQAQVFLPFTRLSQAKVEGHGLGLSVVQRIVERLGGEVGLVCEIGRGCTFSFTLPIADCEDDAAAAVDAGAAAGGAAD